MPLQRLIPLKYGCLTGLASTACALLGVAVAQAKPPEKPFYLASMKFVHTVEQTHHTYSPRKATPALEQGDNEIAPDNSLRVKGEARDAMQTDEGTQNEDFVEDGDAPGPKAEETAEKISDSGCTGPYEFTGTVSAIGDSVMLGAVGGLQKGIHGLTVVDAEVGLQVYAATDTLRYRRASGQLGEVVVVHLGNNGTFTRGQFDEIMRTLSGVDRVVFVNVKVPRTWEESNNEVIAEGVARYPNAELVDWHSASVNRPKLFYSDGYHLRPEGRRLYAGLISSYLPEE